MKKTRVILIAAVAAVIILCLTCTATVPTGYTGILTTFGRVENGTLEAGFHVKSPVQQIVLMDNREQKTAFVTESFSSDIQQVDVTGSVNYAINKSTAMTLFKEVGTDYYSKLVQPRMLEIIKGAFSQYTAENLVANRQTLSTKIRENLAAELEKYGINVISINIENIDFTDAFTDAVEAKQVAAQKKLQAQIEEEQKTMEAQQQAERKRISAEAEAAVQKINADAEAYAVRVKSEAEAAANELIAASVTDELIRFNEVKNWNGQLPTFVAGEGSSMMPILNMGETKEDK
ncbi:MAG: SPFH domain-containing protein [Clostridia bacterium]|nr:SPFH domain-containing protein [Clostridia bacterium]